MPKYVQKKVLNSRMRIALIYLGRRGAGGWISLELARQFQNHYPTLAVISHYSEQLSTWKTLKTEHLVIPTYHNIISAIISLLIPIKINGLVKKIETFHPDVLLFPMFHPWNALIEQRMPGIPSVIFVHDPQYHPDIRGWFYSKLEQVSIRQAELCVILSKNLLNRMIQRGQRPEYIDVIPLGNFRISPRYQLIPIKREIPTILFFGRIVSYKGLNILLHAYADIRQTHQACLVIAGEGNLKPYQSMLERLSDIKIINKWIPEDEIENLFLQCDILVLPYTGASQSGVIPIAAAFGMPVIATRTGGISEQIEDGESGWLIQPKSKDALVAAIIEALDKPDLAQERGDALRKRYETQFNWEKIANDVVKSLKNAVRGKVQK